MLFKLVLVDTIRKISVDVKCTLHPKLTQLQAYSAKSIFYFSKDNLLRNFLRIFISFSLSSFQSSPYIGQGKWLPRWEMLSNWRYFNGDKITYYSEWVFWMLWSTLNRYELMRNWTKLALVKLRNGRLCQQGIRSYIFSHIFRVPLFATDITTGEIFAIMWWMEW